MVRGSPVREDKCHGNFVRLPVAIRILLLELLQHLKKLFRGGRDLCSHRIQPLLVDKGIVIDIRIVKHGRHPIDIAVGTGNHLHQIGIFLADSALEIRRVLINKVI